MTDDALAAEIRRRHAAAVEAGHPGYLDPATGLFVFTARHHRQRGICCHNDCRHCPFGRPPSRAQRGE